MSYGLENYVDGVPVIVDSKPFNLVANLQVQVGTHYIPISDVVDGVLDYTLVYSETLSRSGVRVTNVSIGANGLTYSCESVNMPLPIASVSCVMKIYIRRF